MVTSRTQNTRFAIPKWPCHSSSSLAESACCGLESGYGVSDLAAGFCLGGGPDVPSGIPGPDGASRCSRPILRRPLAPHLHSVPMTADLLHHIRRNQAPPSVSLGRTNALLFHRHSDERAVRSHRNLPVVDIAGALEKEPLHSGVGQLWGNVVIEQMRGPGLGS